MGGGFVSGVRVRLTFVVAALALVAVACPPDPGPPTGDTTPPVLSLPAPITVAVTSVFGATATYTASASDAVSGPVTPACTPASGANFPVGTTTVTCSATDAANNTATGTFTVTVTDTTPPTVTVPPGVTVEATGADGAAVTFTATAVDATDGTLTPTCTPPSGSTFALGTSTVTCSATDAAGNTATGSFNVTVEDTTGPVLSLPTAVTVEATGPSGTPATWTSSASDLVDGTVGVTCAPASGSTFASARLQP